MTFETREELVAHPEIHAFMQQLVDETTRWLPPHERIRQIVLLPRELTMGDGEVSPTLKVKRRVVEEKYRDVIEEMFSRHAPQRIRRSGVRRSGDQDRFLIAVRPDDAAIAPLCSPDLLIIRSPIQKICNLMLKYFLGFLRKSARNSFKDWELSLKLLKSVGSVESFPSVPWPWSMRAVMVSM